MSVSSPSKRYADYQCWNNATKENNVASDELDLSAVNELTNEFASVRANRVARNSVTALGVVEASVDRRQARNYQDTFGVSLKTAKTVTGQRHSGRCWMFSTLNVLRSKVLANLDIDDFEFSQNYIQFYDKLERCNSRLEYVIDTADRPWSDREVTQLMLTPVEDGGQFVFCCNLVKKWGAIPKALMPDTACNKDTAQMNALLTTLLRKDATILRKMAAEGATLEELRAKKQEMLPEFHQILCCCLGEPPVTFDLAIEVGENADVDASKVEEVVSANGGEPRRVLRDHGITPQQFVERYVKLDLSQYVELVNFPGETRPYEHAYGIRYFDPVIGGQRLRFLNMPMEDLENAAVESLKAGVPAFMMCAVNKNLMRKDEDFSGVLALDGMDLDGTFGVDLSQTKAEMIDDRECGMTHCMAFQGVELGEDGKPVAWRVENSWGDDFGFDGYLVMDADWFRLYGGDVVVERRFLPQRILDLWDTLPLEDVDYWDNMLAIG